MSTFRPKDIFQQAQNAERQGNKRVASSHFATLAVYLRRKGSIADATTLIHRAIRLSPSSARLYLQLALCEEISLNQTAAEDAIATFTRYALEKKKVEEYKPYLESALKDQPRLRQVFYDRLIEVDRTDARPFLSKAQAYIAQKDWDRALVVLLDGLQTKTHQDDVVLLLQEVIAEKNDAAALAHLGNFQMKKLNLEDLVSLLSPAKAEAKMNANLRASDATKKPAVKIHADPRPREPEVEKIDPEEKDLQVLIRELESEIGVKLEGPGDSVGPLVKEFRRRSQPILLGDSKARIDMALAFFEMGLLEDARDELKPVVFGDRFYPEAQCLLGEVLYAEGSDLGALEAYQNCLRVEDASPDLLCEARYRLAHVYFRLGDHKEALRLVKRLEKDSPNYRELRFLKIQIQEAASLRKR